MSRSPVCLRTSASPHCNTSSGVPRSTASHVITGNNNMNATCNTMSGHPIKASITQSSHQSDRLVHGRLRSLTCHLRGSPDGPAAATCQSLSSSQRPAGVFKNSDRRNCVTESFGATWQTSFASTPPRRFPAMPSTTAARRRECAEPMAHCSKWDSSLEPASNGGNWETMERMMTQSGTLESENELSNGAGAGEGSDTFAYQFPSPEISKIVDAPPTPVLSFSPLRDKIVHLQRPGLPPVEDLAKPELKLAGVRINPDSNTRSRMSSYTGIAITELQDDGQGGPERQVSGLPEGAKINFVSWSPDGCYLAFAVHVDVEEQTEEPAGLALWIADVRTGEAKQLFGYPLLQLNTVFDSYGWIDEKTIVACVVPPLRGKPPQKSLKPVGPRIQSNESGEKAQARTYQDLLKDQHDKDLFTYYATSQLVLVTLDGEIRNLNEPLIYTSVEPSPDGKYLLVVTIHEPFSFVVPCGRFPKKVEVWTHEGVRVHEICDLPLAENIPIAFNSVRTGRRSIGWRPDQPASLSWAETQDGGDAKVECSPRDIVYTADVRDPNLTPKLVAILDLRYGGIAWGDDSLALVYESWWKQRRSRTWVIRPGDDDPSVQPKLLFDRSYEDVYSDPGSPMTRRTPLGTYILAKIVLADGAERLLLNGNGATPDGYIPFLDLLNVETGEKERIWQSDKELHYESVVALMSDNEKTLYLDKLKILFSRESQREPPQYFLKKWSSQEIVQITNFPHPYPELKDLSKEIIRYQRNDGVQLTATLYLPPGYDPKVEGPLTMLMWAYPREFKSKDAAGQVRGSPNQFAGIGGTSPLLWLAKRYSILDGPTMPIVAEGDDEPNDRFVEQLVGSAQAAVDEVIRRGVAHPKRIAIGGHSYGAFMAANLLARAPDLFCCGIARSGAYNRTLTPFGFQSEERTLWEAPNTYHEMSPFMLANKVHKPLLLIHGEDDNNSGTFPMQSERFYSALKGHGAVTRLVLLPHESHGYRARESTMHTLWEMERWMQEYADSVIVESNKENDNNTENGTKDGSTSSPAGEKTVAAAGVREESGEKAQSENEEEHFADSRTGHIAGGNRSTNYSRKPWSSL